MTTKEHVKKVLAANDIVKVIGHFTPVTGLKAECPNPDCGATCTIHPKKKLYYCFTCQKGGDIIQFLQDHEDISFAEAITRLTSSSDPTTAPAHHQRYARAWSLYRDEGLSKEAKLSLEREMDSAQNLFSRSEFNIFKVYLHGYVAFWDRQAKKLNKSIKP